ncbi:S41 family peptidase [candidate division WOR-3 bacterium]|nr:S41 family peptidase [candidate division WOR-3 bacterium]
MKKKILICFVSLIVLYSNITAYAQDDGLYQEMMFFSNVLNHIKANYVEEVPPSKLIGYAVYGVLTSLDPHTIYMGPHQFEKFLEITKGKAYGVGIEFAIIDGLPTVISVIRGGPADNNTIQTGDVLIKVDDKYVTDKTEPELQLLLAGEKGSKVDLTFKKPSMSGEFIVEIKRGGIPVNSVDYHFIEEHNTGYIKIDHFSLETKNEFSEALKKLKKKGMNNLVLDLRDNPGGVVEGAVGVVDLFIPKDENIVEIKGRKEISNETISSTDCKKEPLYPIIVLVNHGSASASELVAGALQDYDRALVVGENSFGKGLVQKPFILQNGGVILMTIAKYYTPSGRIIQRDYEGKSLREYFSEIKAPDTTDLDSSSIFATKGGRKVFGNGGITPDIIIRVDTTSILETRELKELICEHGIEFVSNKKNLLKSYKKFDDYAKNFTIDEKLQKEFMTKAKEKGLDLKELKKEEQNIKNLLKTEIAGIYWGKKEEMILSLKNDFQLQDALGNLNEAKKILELYSKNFGN